MGESLLQSRSGRRDGAKPQASEAFRVIGKTIGESFIIGIAQSSLTSLAQLCYARSSAKGFTNATTVDDEKQLDLFLAKLMLVVSECGEVAEAARKPALRGEIPEEFADIIIRVLDMCGALGIDIGLAVTEKLAKNATRPHLHGKAI